MTTMLERREAVTGRRTGSKSNFSLVEQKRMLDEATKKTVGLATRVLERHLENRLKDGKPKQD